MPDAISIIGLTATFVPWPIHITGAIAKNYTKDTAKNNFNDAADQYKRMKEYRQDLDEFFTEDERAELDGAIKAYVCFGRRF